VSAPTVNGRRSAYPREVEELLPVARDLVDDGRLPSKRRVKETLRVGDVKAAAILEALGDTPESTPEVAAEATPGSPARVLPSAPGSTAEDAVIPEASSQPAVRVGAPEVTPAPVPSGPSPSVAEATTEATGPTVSPSRRWTSRLGAGAVAAIAAVASYSHMRHLALACGQEDLIATLLPLSVDGLVMVGAVAIGDGRRHTWSAWLAFWVGVAASIAANVLAARPDPISRVVSAWPAIALLLVVEVISRSGRGRAVAPGVTS
jgi:hypothetical protein